MAYFFVLNVIIGFIIEVILAYLNLRYSKRVCLSNIAISQIREGDEYSESTESDESDENVFVDDEAEKDLEARVRELINNLNKGITSNVKALGELTLEEQAAKDREFNARKKDEMPVF